jgi:hypothetical protein
MGEVLANDGTLFLQNPYPTQLADAFGLQRRLAL